MYDTKHLFKGLILSCMMLTATAGCTNNVSIADDPIRIFNREYYAVKDMTPADVWKMKEMMQSGDKGAAVNAGLILGRHYVRQGETEKGYKMIKDNLDDSYLDRFMKVSGHLWAYDAAVKMNDAAFIEKEKDILLKTEMDEKAIKAFKVYCGQEKKLPADENFKSCIDNNKPTDIFKPEIKEEHVKEKPVPLPVLPPAPPKTEIPVKLSGSSKTEALKLKMSVSVKNSVNSPEVVEAVLYTMSKLKINADLDFQGEKTSYDYVLDASEKTLTVSTDVIDFSVDRKKETRMAMQLVIGSGAKHIALGYAEGMRDTASEIADEFRNQAEIMIFNIQDKEFQARLKEIKSKTGGNSLSYVLTGSQDQVLKVIPFTKYYSPRPDKTVIAAAIDSLSKKYYNSDYDDYTRNSIVVTDIVLTENPAAEKFTAEFSKDFGKSPSLNYMIGYDMLVFMEKYRNPDYKGEYLTGITEVKNGEVIRKTKAYRVISGGKLKVIEN